MNHCCERMVKSIQQVCDKHADPYDCPDALMTYIPKFDEYGLIIHDGGHSQVQIHHCPWCGKKLPDSKRNLWFDRLAELGFDDPFDQDIPAEFKSDDWYKNEK